MIVDTTKELKAVASQLAAAAFTFSHDRVRAPEYTSEVNATTRGGEYYIVVIPLHPTSNRG